MQKSKWKKNKKPQSRRDKIGVHRKRIIKIKIGWSNNQPKHRHILNAHGIAIAEYTRLTYIFLMARNVYTAHRDTSARAHAHSRFQLQFIWTQSGWCIFSTMLSSITLHIAHTVCVEREASIAQTTTILRRRRNSVWIRFVFGYLFASIWVSANAPLHSKRDCHAIDFYFGFDFIRFLRVSVLRIICHVRRAQIYLFILFSVYIFRFNSVVFPTFAYCVLISRETIFHFRHSLSRKETIL